MYNVNKGDPWNNNKVDLALLPLFPYVMPKFPTPLHDTYLLGDTSLLVLFDFGATHLFVY